MEKSQVDLVLRGQYVCTMDADGTVIENGAVAVKDGRIVAVGTVEDVAAGFRGDVLLEEPHGLVMPGLVNVHTHAPMACFRGLADDLPLMQWLQEYIFPVEAELTGEMVYLSSLLSICEMIKSGTTSFCDMYLFADQVAGAARESGMRAWVGEVLYDFPSPNYGALENGYAYTRDLLDRWSGEELINITIDPHAVYTCSPDLLTTLGKMAADTSSLYHIHLSENEDEVNTCLERYGCTPVEHLENLGLLGENVVAAHCVQLKDQEIELLAERGVGAAHCPESNMKLASGVARIPELLQQGGKVGIGTDGAASNNDVDMFGEMNSAAKIHKVTRMDPTAMDATTTLKAATTGGAAVLGAQELIGSIEVGKAADLVVVDLDKPHLTPVYNPVSHLVYAVRGNDVKHSIIGGKMVMRDRKLLTLDEAKILADIRQATEAIRSGRNVG